jgi:uncharacterized protein
VWYATSMQTLAPHSILLQGVVGSTAYGLNHANSDIDTLGIFAESPLTIASLNWHNDDESEVRHEPDATLHEARKFARLALKANPTILELLYLNEYMVMTDHGMQLIENRSTFLDPERVKGSYGGFASQQIARFERNVKNGKVEAKPARHVLRLINQGTELLGRGTLTVKVTDPQKYFDLQYMHADDIVTFLKRKMSEFDNFHGPSALRSFDPDFANSWLNDVRRYYL